MRHSSQHSPLAQCLRAPCSQPLPSPPPHSTTSPHALSAPPRPSCPLRTTPPPSPPPLLTRLSRAAVLLLPSMTYPTALNRQLLSLSTTRRTTHDPSPPGTGTELGAGPACGVRGVTEEVVVLIRGCGFSGEQRSQRSPRPRPDESGHTRADQETPKMHTHSPPAATHPPPAGALVTDRGAPLEGAASAAPGAAPAGRGVAAGPAPDTPAPDAPAPAPDCWDSREAAMARASISSSSSMSAKPPSAPAPAPAAAECVAAPAPEEDGSDCKCQQKDYRLGKPVCRYGTHPKYRQVPINLRLRKGTIRVSSGSGKGTHAHTPGGPLAAARRPGEAPAPRLGALLACRRLQVPAPTQLPRWVPARSRMTRHMPRDQRSWDGAAKSCMLLTQDQVASSSHAT